MSDKQNIRTMSDDDLKELEGIVRSELKDRQELADRKERQRNAAVLKELAEHKDTIMVLFEHELESCSDEKPCNGIADDTYRCGKCALIKLLEDAHWMTECDWHVRLTVDLTRYP